MSDEAIVLFDGTCNFCNGAVQFMIDRERKPELKFAPLQSDLAVGLLEKAFGPEQAKLLREGLSGNGDPDSIVLIEGDKGYTHSTAGLRIASRLRFPWRLGILGFLTPRFLRDAIYRYIARNRYRWFGKSDTCRIPTPEFRQRFLA